MKKTLISLFFISIVYSSSFAQEKRINLYGAYAFDDKVTSTYDSYNYYEAKVLGGFHYGAGIEFNPKPDMGVELLWMGQTTTVPTYYASSSYYGYYREQYSVFDLNANYAMLAFNGYTKRPGTKLEGYGGIMLGALFVSMKNPDTGSSGSSTKFSWGLRAGGNFWTSEKVAIKLQAQVLSAVQSVGGSLYFGTGGAGAGVSTYSSMLQFAIGGGLVFALGK